MRNKVLGIISIRAARLLLAGILVALLFAPPHVSASETGARLGKVAGDRDAVVETFEAAERKGHFKSKKEADRVRAQLDLVNSLLKEAKHELHKHKPHHAGAKLDAAEALIEQANEASGP